MIGDFAFGVVMACVMIVGLFLASGAQDASFALFGYILAAFGLFMCCFMLHRITGSPPKLVLGHDAKAAPADPAPTDTQKPAQAAE